MTFLSFFLNKMYVHNGKKSWKTVFICFIKKKTQTFKIFQYIVLESHHIFPVILLGPIRALETLFRDLWQDLRHGWLYVFSKLKRVLPFKTALIWGHKKKSSRGRQDYWQVGVLVLDQKLPDSWRVVAKSWYT